MTYGQELRARILDPRIAARAIVGLERELSEVLFDSPQDGSAMMADLVTAWRFTAPLDRRRKNWLWLVGCLWEEFDYGAQSMWLAHLRAVVPALDEWESAFLLVDFLGTHAADDRCMALLMDLPGLSHCEAVRAMIPNGWKRAAGNSDPRTSARAKAELARRRERAAVPAKVKRARR
jgi:hypothetical protein